MADALHSNADQLAYSRVDSTGAAAFHALGSAVTVSTVPRPEIAAVLLRPGSAQLADKTVRQAVAAAVDRSALIATGADGGPATDLVANDLVVAPSQPGYRASMPSDAPGATPDPSRVPALLAQAGYVQNGSNWTRGGHDLDLEIAAPAGRQPYVDIANQLRDQLVGAGIPATVETPPAGQLYEQLLSGSPPTTVGANSTVRLADVVVGPQPAGGDPATELASWFGCPTSQGAAAPPPSCDQALRSTVQSAITGEQTLTAALAKAEPALWSQAVEIPLFQVADQLAVGEQVSGVTSGPPFAGPFFGAASWSRVTER
jgi:ABC-type transport system substrate-binding protein